MTALAEPESSTIDPAEYPNCVDLLAQLRYTSALNLPDPVGALTSSGARAIETTSGLIRLADALGWDDAIRARMARLPVLER